MNDITLIGALLLLKFEAAHVHFSLTRICLTRKFADLIFFFLKVHIFAVDKILIQAPVRSSA